MTVEPIALDLPISIERAAAPSGQAPAETLAELGAARSTSARDRALQRLAALVYRRARAVSAAPTQPSATMRCRPPLFF